MKQESSMSQILGIKGFWLYEFLDRQYFFKNKALLIVIEFILPPLFLFSFPLRHRFSNVLLYSVWRIISLFAAASWSFWGPYFIYQYHAQFIKFYENLSFLGNHSIRKTFYDVYNGFQKRVLITSLVWGLLAVIIIIKPETLRGYSFYGYTDLWYWIFLLYILFSLHLTACGFIGVQTSFCLLKRLANSNLMTDLLQQKPRKLTAFGQFSFSTVLYFSSGISFIPILIDFIQENKIYPQIFIIIGIALFIVVTCIAFFYPLWLVNRCAYKSRESLLDKLESEYINHLYSRRHCKWDFFQSLRQIDRYNSLRFVQSIKIELLDSSKAFTVFATLIMPIIIAVLERTIPQDVTITSLFNSLLSQ